MTDEQFAWWLVGLVDGEGHFGITRQWIGEERRGPYYRCVFRVQMVGDDTLLRMAHARTGWGGLYAYERAGSRVDGRPLAPTMIWSCNTRQVALRGSTPKVRAA